MAKKKPIDMTQHIHPLYMNGLQGRMLRLPARNKKKREILLIYGHHASIERMFGIAEDLSKYGNITLPDLPGFGGMESFYKIGEKPTLDNLADYLAAFVKMRYKRKRLTIMGMSFGFLIATRMLQRYPELSKKIDLVVSVVGFVHHEDFKFKKRTFLFFRYGSSFFSRQLPAAFARHIILRKTCIKAAYAIVADKHSKLKDADKDEQKKRIDFEVKLWHCNDVRTYMDTSITMLKANLCDGKRVNLPVYHVEVENDRYFDNRIVEQHMGVIYEDVHIIKSKMPGHAPTVIADAKEAAQFVPKKIRRLLAKAA